MTHRPALPPLDPEPAPLHPRYGGVDPDAHTLAEAIEAERLREQGPAPEPEEPQEHR